MNQFIIHIFSSGSGEEISTYLSSPYIIHNKKYSITLIDGYTKTKNAAFLSIEDLIFYSSPRAYILKGNEANLPNQSMEALNLVKVPNIY